MHNLHLHKIFMASAVTNIQQPSQSFQLNETPKNQPKASPIPIDLETVVDNYEDSYSVGSNITEEIPSISVGESFKSVRIWLSIIRLLSMTLIFPILIFIILEPYLSVVGAPIISGVPPFIDTIVHIVAEKKMDVITFLAVLAAIGNLVTHI